ncbi:hypothetical protein L7F22_037626 [Adiantum nelumboides]|nr:hypothetical protein [Adiantum nelumboides]
MLGNIHEFGFGFSLSKTKAGSALHLRFTQGSGKIRAWRGMHGEATQQQFESNKLPRFHLKDLLICLAGGEPETIDPMMKCIYDALHLRHVDAGIWELELNARRALEKFESPKNPNLLKGFSQILVPMSLAMEVLYGNLSETNQACGMVHYAMVEKLRNDLKCQAW